jgi:hypothetical protein
MNNATEQLSTTLSNVTASLQVKMESACQVIGFMTEAEMMETIMTNPKLDANEKSFIIQGVMGFKAAAKAQEEALKAREILVAKMNPTEYALFVLNEEKEAKEKAERDQFIAKMGAKAYSAVSAAGKVRRSVFESIGYAYHCVKNDISAGGAKADGIK